MRVVLFCHSLRSDWNHGNAHFLRGICTELLVRGHEVRVLEPADGWSYRNLVEDAGAEAEAPFRQTYPNLDSRFYDPARLDLHELLDGADLVLVHEWTDPLVMAGIGRHRVSRGGHRLLFHDTHHRMVTDAEAQRSTDLSGYDGVLAFGAVLTEIYERRGWGRQAWTWHEAADTRVFKPIAGDKDGDLVWIGNWGDEERSQELSEYLIEPVQALGLAATVHGVRYPDEAQDRLAAAGIRYRGYLPNPYAPAVFARHKATVHVPRRPYADALPGIPTIRVFEALACGIPLVSAPWSDSEGLFDVGRDFLMVDSGGAMRSALRTILHEPAAAEELAQHGRRTIEARHTCRHRVDELMSILASLEQSGAPACRVA